MKTFRATRDFRRRLLTTASLLALLPAAAAVKADPGDILWGDASNYQYLLNNVPDIDQQRAPGVDPWGAAVFGLPNGGQEYCVPTSCTNWTAYLANHSLPGLTPGPGNWQLNDAATLNTMTTDIQTLAVAMSTDPFGGTYGDNACIAMRNALSPYWWTADLLAANGSYAPTQTDLALQSLDGRLVDAFVGWYNNYGGSYYRNGGHAVSLVSANGPVNPQIGIHDPDDPDDNLLLSNQSAFTTDTYSTQDVSAVFDGNYRTQSAVLNYYGGFLDGAVVLKPYFILVWDWDLIYYIRWWWWWGPDPVEQFTPAVTAPILDLVYNPTQPEHPYLQQNSNAVWLLNTLTGKSRALTEISQPQRLVQGGAALDLYVAGAKQLTRLNAQGRLLAQTSLRTPLDALAFQERSQTLVGISRSQSRLILFNSKLSQIAGYPLPVPAVGRTGRLSISVSPTDGAIWTHLDGSPVVYRLALSPTGGLKVQGLKLNGAKSPTGLDVDEHGLIFISDQKTIHAYDASGAERKTPFTGKRGGQGLHVVRSYSNYDPQILHSPAWRNVPPSRLGR